MPLPKDVYVRDLQSTLLDIESRTAELREMLEWRPEAFVATVHESIKLACVPELDHLPLPERPAAIVVRPLGAGNFVAGEEDIAAGGVGPVPPPLCPPGGAGCGRMLPDPEVSARDLCRAMRNIELLAGACRAVLGMMRPNEMFRRPAVAKPGTAVPSPGTADA